MIKNIDKFISRGIKRSTNGVHITPTHIIATDTYKLIKIKQPSDIKEAYTFELPKGVKTFDTIERHDKEVRILIGGNTLVSKVIDETYPDIEAVIPVGEPVVKITISTEHLAEIAEAIKKSGQVELSYYGEIKPLVFTTKNEAIKILLMPIPN